MKQCSRCKKVLSETEFYKQQSSKDGLQYYCKKCKRESIYIWRENNPEKIKEINNRYWHSKKGKLASKRHRIKYPDKVKRRIIKWKEENREKIRGYNKEWRKNNPDKIRSHKRKYRRKYPKKCREQKRRWIKNNPEYGEKWKQDNPTKVREHQRRVNARRRKLGYVPLWVNPFPEGITVHYHHVNNIFTIPLPEKTHLKFLGKNHRNRCNSIVERIYNIELERILCP